MTLKASEVFVPGGFPTYTYVERADQKLQQRLIDGLEEIGKFVSVSGPSKSGKTVLIEKVVGKTNLIPITGAGIQSADEVWNRVLNWMEVPNEISTASQENRSVNSVTGADISAGIPLLGAGSVNTRLENHRGNGEEQRQVSGRRGLTDVVREIGGSDFVILLDDFHYIGKEVQIEVMRQIKEAVRLQVRICVASVLHRADEAIRANQEMQGRFTVVDLDYWDQEELEQIAEAGFSALQLSLPNHVRDTFSNEAAGSPQLMQTLCLQACRNLDHRQSLGIPIEKTPTIGEIETVLEDASNTMDFRSIVDILDCGPKERGRERKVYVFKDGSRGDVYRCILKCIAQNPPRLSFSYDELLHRAGMLCDGESPSGSSMQGSCEHMIRLAQDKFPTERQIDWNREREVLDIAEPYLLFYLRWSSRLSEANT